MVMQGSSAGPIIRQNARVKAVSAANGADTEIGGLIVGTSDHQGTAANSLVLSNITDDGDIQMLVSDGGNSKEFLLADGDTAILHLGQAMASILLSKTISIAAGVVTGATSVTSTAFLGTIDGVVGGNTPAAITGTTVDATTDFTIGSTVITDGVITDSSGLQLAAALDINGVADISGDLTMSAGNIDLNNQGGVLNVGASGNDWTANSLAVVGSVAGAQAMYLHNVNGTNATTTRAFLEVKVSATAGNASGDPSARFTVAGGASWAIGVDNSEDGRFAIGNDSDLGSSADAVRISTAEEITFQNSTGSDYDYVCGGCGKSSLETFVCCGKVEWHDDVLAVRESRLSPEGFQHMAKLGILEIDGPDTTSPGWVGINYQKAQNFTWAGMWQNRQRMDSQYEQLNKRLEAIGA